MGRPMPKTQLVCFRDTHFFFFYCFVAHQDLHSFPTRRLFRSVHSRRGRPGLYPRGLASHPVLLAHGGSGGQVWTRSEEHTSELQSQFHLVCRLLLEKKKQTTRLFPGFGLLVPCSQ